MKTALTIAGTDPSGGAGIQADIKAMTMNGVFATSAITALVAQNTTGVKEIAQVPPEFLAAQIDAVFEDIYPDAVKIGMVFSKELIDVIEAKLRYYSAKNIVVDPVMVATSGDKLISDGAIEALKERLLPIATIITPNIPEAEILSGTLINGERDMETAAKRIKNTYGCAVLLKGGHSICDANDYLYADSSGEWLYGERVNNPNTHGTGCTLSSTIAANLAKGFGLREAVKQAKAYLTGALLAMLDLGKGPGPLKHNFNLSGEFAEEWR